MGLAATLDVDTAPGRVTFLLHLRNEGTNPIDLQFPTAQTVDITVSDPAGNTVWEHADGQMFAQRTSTASLAPGEDMVLDAAWTDPPPGRYRALGRVAATPSASATTEFEIADD